MAGQAGGAGGAVALADQVQRRGPAVVPGQVHPDELADRLEVSVKRVELAVQLGFRGAGIAGPDRVDEDQIGAIEPGRLIIDQPVRRGGDRRPFGGRHPPRAEGPEVQPDRRRARSAIEAEHQRARFRGPRVIPRVGDREDPRLHLALGIPDRHQGGGRGVRQRLAFDHDRVMGDDRFFIGRGPGGVLLRLRWFSGLGLRRGLRFGRTLGLRRHGRTSWLLGGNHPEGHPQHQDRDRNQAGRAVHFFQPQ